MNNNKKYFWLKLKDDFFEDETIKYIEEQENGILYVNFYLKLCLKSIKSEGRLIRAVGNTFMPYDANSLARLTGVNVDVVRVAMELFKSIGLVDILETGEIYLPQIEEMVGSETGKAESMRRLRAERKERILIDSNNVTEEVENCYTEKEIEKEIEKGIKEKDKKEKKHETSVSIIDAYTSNPTLKDALTDYVKMRHQMKGYTIRALKTNLNTLSKLTDNEDLKIKIVEQSIEHSWKSFYKLKYDDLEQMPTYQNENTKVSQEELERMFKTWQRT